MLRGMKTAVATRMTIILASLLGLTLIAGCSLMPVASGSGLMGGGMMGGVRRGAGQAGPGQAGFVAGTPAAPRIVRIVAGPGEVFSPSEIDIAPGETVTFAVTAVGPGTHEFKVGPAAVVAADGDAPEVADLGMMQTKSLTYTFDGPGPFAFACHQPGHYEAGMRGTIKLVG
jgi:plastocyanin